MSTLTNTQIRNTYDALLKLADNGNLTTVLKEITDGLGNVTPLSISQVAIKSSVDIEAFGFKTPTGTSSQFLKADGSIDSSIYLTSYIDTNTQRSDAEIQSIIDTNTAGFITSYIDTNTQLSDAEITALGYIKSYINTTYVSSDFNHNDLSGVSANEHIDWTGASAGTIHITNLPATAITSVQIASTQVAMLALTTQEGDVVVRSDENKTYMHNGGTAGNMADFTELSSPTGGVSSVDGATGAVVLNHDTLTGFVANEHIDWTTDRGATNIHSGNYINTNTQLSDADITALGYIKSYIDTNTQLSESEITAMGFIKTQSDSQSLSISGNTISLTNGGSVTVPDNDTTYTNVSEFINDSGYTGDQDLSGYLLNTTDTLTGTLIVNGGTGVSSSGTLLVQQNGDGSGNGITLTSSNALSHRIWKGANGSLNIGPSSLPSSFVQTTSGNVGIGTDLSGGLPDKVVIKTGGQGVIKDALMLTTGQADNFAGTGVRINMSGVSEANSDVRHSYIESATSSAGNDHYLAFATNSVGSDATERMRITSGGNVGIGTDSPSTNFQVGDGTTNTSSRFYHNDNSYTQVNGYGLSFSRLSSYIRPVFDGTQDLYFGNINTTWKTIQFDATTITFDNNSSEAMRIDSAGNVGIGTDSPDYTLEVMKASPTNGIVADFVNSTNAGGTTSAIKLSNADSEVCDVVLGANRVNAGFGSDFFISPSDGIDGTNRERFRITKAGNVGIGTDGPSYKLDVSGNGRFTSTVTATNFVLSSDKRLKKDLLPLYSKRLSPSRWTWIDSGEKDFGFIAQELEVDFPEVVITGEDGFKKVAYNKITAINSARINELEDEVYELKRKLELIMQKLDI